VNERISVLILVLRQRGTSADEMAAAERSVQGIFAPMHALVDRIQKIESGTDLEDLLRKFG